MPKISSLIIIILVYALPSCSKNTVEMEDILLTELDSIPFGSRELSGTIDNKDIDEASGLVASIQHPGYFWTHNDSGDEARLFFIHESGKTQAQVTISGARNRDWEDIALSFDPITQNSTLWIADIGDNRAQYSYVTLYMVEEPSFEITHDTILSVTKKMTLVYPDGPRDAETLMTDPKTQDIFVLSKREPEVSLYRIQYPYPQSDTIILEKVLTLPVTQIVGGDISGDGSEILIKNYDTVYYYTRQPDETPIDAMRKTPVILPYIREPQGEAICFSFDKRYFYTLSEKSPLGITPVLYRYERK